MSASSVTGDAIRVQAYQLDPETLAFVPPSDDPSEPTHEVKQLCVSHEVPHKVGPSPRRKSEKKQKKKSEQIGPESGIRHLWSPADMR